MNQIRHRDFLGFFVPSRFDTDNISRVIPGIAVWLSVICQVWHELLLIAYFFLDRSETALAKAAKILAFVGEDFFTNYHEQPGYLRKKQHIQKCCIYDFSNISGIPGATQFSMLESVWIARVILYFCRYRLLREWSQPKQLLRSQLCTNDSGRCFLTAIPPIHHQMKIFTIFIDRLEVLSDRKTVPTLFLAGQTVCK